MYIICLTGGAGAGKSYVSKILNDKFNIPVIDSDLVAKELMMPEKTVYDAVVKEFGDDIVGLNGLIDRQKLASIVFSDKNKLRKLNNITHPATIEEINRLIKEYEHLGQRFVFVESAIALESGYTNFCDEIWYVYSDEATRRRRLSDRGYTEEKINQVMLSQNSDDYFRNNCQMIIDNSDNVSPEILFDMVDKALQLFIDNHSLI